MSLLVLGGVLSLCLLVAAFFLSAVIHEGSPRVLVFACLLLSSIATFLLFLGGWSLSLVLAVIAIAGSVAALALLPWNSGRFFKSGDILRLEEAPVTPQHRGVIRPSFLLDGLFQQFMASAEMRALAESPPESYCAFLLPSVFYRKKEYTVRVVFSASFLMQMPGYLASERYQTITATFVSQTFDFKPEQRSVRFPTMRTASVPLEFAASAKSAGHHHIRLELCLNGVDAGYREEKVCVRVNAEVLTAKIAAVVAFLSAIVGIMKATHLLK